MSLIYTEFEFLELFDEKRVIDAEIKAVEYKLNLEGLFVFNLSIMPYDEYASVSLSCSKWEYRIFDIGLNRIVKIELDNKKAGHVFLDFYGEKSEELVFRMLVKPNISIQYSID